MQLSRMVKAGGHGFQSGVRYSEKIHVWEHLRHDLVHHEGIAFALRKSDKYILMKE